MRHSPPLRRCKFHPFGGERGDGKGDRHGHDSVALLCDSTVPDSRVHPLLQADRPVDGQRVRTVYGYRIYGNGLVHPGHSAHTRHPYTTLSDCHAHQRSAL